MIIHLQNLTLVPYFSDFYKIPLVFRELLTWHLSAYRIAFWHLQEYFYNFKLQQIMKAFFDFAFKLDFF